MSEVVGVRNGVVGIGVVTGERDEMVSVSEVVGVRNRVVGIGVVTGGRDDMVSV